MSRFGKVVFLFYSIAFIISFSSLSQENLPVIIKKIQPSTVIIITYKASGEALAQGSGFFISQNGDVITNRHVIEGASQAEVKANDGKVYRVKQVLAVDNEGDCARLSLETATTKTFPALSLSATVPDVGEKIIVIGSPLGLEQTVSDGIVSAVRDIPNFGNIIQISAPISPGSSGGPVVNMKGEVIGIATFQYKEGQNLNFAIPSERIKKLQVAKTTSIADWNAEKNNDLNSSAERLYQTGLAFVWGEKYEEALRYFEKVVEINPKYAEAYFQIGYCNGKIGRHQEAVKAYKQAISLYPYDENAYFNLGLSYRQIGNYQEEIEAYKKAIGINPNLGIAYYWLGNAYSGLDRYREAIEAYKEALRINPDDFDANYHLGLAYGGFSMFREAIEAYKQAIRISPNYEEAHCSLGIAYAVLGRYREAAEAAKQAIRINPNNAEAHYLLGMAYLDLKDNGAALDEYKVLKTLDADRANKLFNMIYK